VENGGKKLGDITPEGNFGEYILAQDTEGNDIAIYTMKK
jgi:predicted enzyme related to lactoylglutathione lyase